MQVCILLHFASSITPSLFFKVTNARRGNVEFWFCMSVCLINWICSLILNPAWETKQQMPLEAADTRTSLYQCPILRSSFSHSNLSLRVLPRDMSRQTSRVNINTLLWLLTSHTDSMIERRRGHRCSPQTVTHFSDDVTKDYPLAYTYTSIYVYLLYTSDFVP